MEYEEAKKFIIDHVCAQCGGGLVTVWDNDKAEHVVLCGAHRSHTGYKMIESASTAVARGNAEKILGPGAQNEMERAIANRPGSISLTVTKDLGNYKDLTAEAINGLVTWAESVGLNARLGHVCLYYGKPYPTIDGYYYILHKRDTMIKVGSRPCNAFEREGLQVKKGDHAWITEGWLGDTKLPTVGYGIVTLDEINEKSEKSPGEFRAPVAHDHPQRMAEKRSEWQLLRKIVPLDTVPGKSEGKEVS